MVNSQFQKIAVYTIRMLRSVCCDLLLTLYFSSQQKIIIVINLIQSGVVIIRRITRIILTLL